MEKEWTLLIFVTMRFHSLVFCIIGDAFIIAECGRRLVVLWIWGIYAGLVVVKVVIEGWINLRFGWFTGIWMGLNVLIVVKLMYFVNLFFFSSRCRCLDDRTTRFTIAIQRLIAGRFICLTLFSSISNYFDCSIVSPFVASFISQISWILSWWIWLIVVCLLLFSWIELQ